METEKSFYVVSGLLRDSSQLGYLEQHATEKDAITHAKNVIAVRARNGKPAIKFHVLKVCAVVTPTAPPVSVRKLK